MDRIAEQSRRERVQSVERALALLHLLARADEPLGISALQRASGLQKTIVFRLLRTLEAHGFVEQDPESVRFRIGLAAFEVGQAYAERDPLRRIALPHMRELVAGSPHGAYLGVLDGFDMVYLDTVESSGPLRVHVTPGARVPAYATAFGKVLLAELGDDAVRELARVHGLRGLTPHTIADVDALLEHLRAVRASGYGLNAEETYPGIGSVAAVIRDRTGAAIASLSVAYPTSLVPPEEVPAWGERTMRSAAEISAQLQRVDVRADRFGAARGA